MQIASNRSAVGLAIAVAAWILGSGSALAQTVQYQATSDWSSGFNGQITFTNDGSQILSQWTLEFDFDRSIDVIWNATIVSHNGTRYRLQSAGWNDQVQPKGTVSIGFGGSPGNVQKGPENFLLTGTSGTSGSGTGTGSGGGAAGESVNLTIAQASQWDGGFTGNLTIVNTGSQPISGWQLSFNFAPGIQSIWNGSFTADGHSYQLQGAGSTATIPPGGTATLGFTATGALSPDSASDCIFDGKACSISILTETTPPPPTPQVGSILIGTVDDSGPVTQFTVAQATQSFTLKFQNTSGASQTDVQFSASANNPNVVSLSVDGSSLVITGLRAGRAGLKIVESKSGSTRYVGVRVLNSDSSLPGLPQYLSVGSVSEDTAEHLNFWQTFDSGNKNHRVDSRYIYLNGGPIQGWDTWTGTPGDRAVSYIRNSRQLGMIPIFVFYNIADSGEGYLSDVAHVQNASYMRAYFTNLKLALDIIRQESPDDPVEMILEPDFLGYLAQNANAPASAIGAATSAAYASGVLSADRDPNFPDSVAGLVRAINYTISKYAPQVVFGWQINLWASPQGGWTTSVPVTGLMHKTDTGDFQLGQASISSEAAGIAAYYVAAGITEYGAGFVSIDKYGLDAPGYESSAAANPAKSVWFWNNDLWQNYLTFAAAIHQTAQLPVILWQLPVGHINSSLAPNPYSTSGTFPDLPNTYQHYEDSAPTFFFGDTFTAAGPRLAYFGSNQSRDTGLVVNDQTITWRDHMKSAADAGIVSILFGPGVGPSTTNLGNPPGDSFWWITKAQEYFANPVPLPPVK